MISQNKSKSSSEVNSSSQSPKAQLAAEENIKFVTRCLVANDDPFQLDYISTVLSQYFNEVDQAENGFVAFKFVQEKRRSTYDLIILDINMPIMGGVEAS
jgi:response regulator RpfG family c-di-GMP phosphodiesterase